MSTFLENRKADIDQLKYLAKHKADVYRSGRELGVPRKQLALHDWSKFKPSKWTAYRDYWFGPESARALGGRDKVPEDIQTRFQQAAKKHFKREDHHIHKKPRQIPLKDVPLNIRKEMLADWYSVSKRTSKNPKDFPDIQTWIKQQELKKMTKLAKEATINLFNKYANEEGRRYPISRAVTNLWDTVGLGLPKVLAERARQGRANVGTRTYTTSENLLAGTIADPESGKTYPISRALTSIPLFTTASAIGGGTAAYMGQNIIGNVLPRKAAIPAGIGLGAAFGALGTITARDIGSRADIGKANIGRKGIGKLKTKQLDAARRGKLDHSEEVTRKMDADTVRALLASIGTGAVV